MHNLPTRHISIRGLTYLCQQHWARPATPINRDTSPLTIHYLLLAVGLVGLGEASGPSHGSYVRGNGPDAWIAAPYSVCGYGAKTCSRI